MLLNVNFLIGFNANRPKGSRYLKVVTSRHICCNNDINRIRRSFCLFRSISNFQAKDLSKLQLAELHDK